MVFDGCIEPITESLWSISVDSILQTDGFARDVAVAENTAFIAAGQSGIQVWDLSSRSKSSGFTGYEEGGTFLEFDDLLLIGRDEANKLIFVSESNEDVKIFHYDLYRLKNYNDISQLGMFEISDDNITIIEWPELIVPKPKDRVDIQFQYSKLIDSRKVKIAGFGKWKDYKFNGI